MKGVEVRSTIAACHVIFAAFVVLAAGLVPTHAQAAGRWKSCGIQNIVAQNGAFGVRARGTSCRQARKLARAIGKSSRRLYDCIFDCEILGYRCGTPGAGVEAEKGLICTLDNKRVRLKGAGHGVNRRAAIASVPFFSATASSLTCSIAKDNGDIDKVAEELSGKEGPLGDQEIEQTFRYPAFRIGKARQSHSAAILRVRAFRYRGPAGLYGSKVVQQGKYGRMSIQADCPAVLSVMRVKRERRCWPSYSPGPGKPDYGPGYACQTKWWPAGGAGCKPSDDGGKSCEWLERKVSLGRPIKVRVPPGPKDGVRVFIRTPPILLIPGRCVCVTNHLPAQGTGGTNTLLLH